MKNTRNLSIVSKIALLTVVTVISTVGLTTAIFIGKMRRELNHLATVSQESRLKTFWELLQQKGELKIIDDQIIAGSTVLNNNYELPDKVSEICGGTATIFMKDMRISTNVKKADGSRAVGTKLQGPAYDAVFKEGKSYRGVAPILGIDYFTAYDPIRDAEGNVIGVLYVGVKKDDFLQTFNQLNIMVSIIAVVLMIIFSAIALFFTRKLLAPLNQAVIITEAVANGDLTVTIPAASNDETGKILDSLRRMVLSLDGMAGRIIKTSTILQDVAQRVTTEAAQVVAAARSQHNKIADTSTTVIEIAASAREVGAETEKLARSAIETSSSLLEMSSSINEVATHTDLLASLVGEVTVSTTQSAASAREIGESAARLVDASAATASSLIQMEASIRNVEESTQLTATISKTVEKDARKGADVMTDMRQGMADIRESSQVTASVIGNLSARVGEIGVITSVIDEIAKQTSLLALNAAIIAAQSGENGKGFTVLADEIKTLAGRTAKSTGEIAAVIRNVQKETELAVNVIVETEKKIAVGETLCHRASDALGEIVIGVDQAGEHIQGIARASTEMASGAFMIREAMDSVFVMNKKIGISTHEQTGASEAIRIAAEKMLYLTDQVRSSTAEQSKVGKAVSRAMNEVASMTAKINRSCAEQADGSNYIANAVTEINSSADASLHAARSLDEASTLLSEQVVAMQRETGAFRLNSQKSDRMQ